MPPHLLSAAALQEDEKGVGVTVDHSCSPARMVIHHVDRILQRLEAWGRKGEEMPGIVAALSLKASLGCPITTDNVFIAGRENASPIHWQGRHHPLTH